MKRVDQWEVVAAVASHVAVVCIQTGNAKVRGVAGHRIPVSGYTIATKLDKLARIARTLHRLYEDACNVRVPTCKKCQGLIEENGVCHGPRKAYAEQCHYYRTERLEARAVAIGTELGIVVTTQSDPRGAPIQLWADKEDGRSLGYFAGRA